MKRRILSRRRDRRIFKKTANRMHVKNLAPVVMRGGIRL